LRFVANSCIFKRISAEIQSKIFLIKNSSNYFRNKQIVKRCESQGSSDGAEWGQKFQWDSRPFVFWPYFLQLCLGVFCKQCIYF